MCTCPKKLKINKFRLRKAKCFFFFLIVKKQQPKGYIWPRFGLGRYISERHLGNSGLPARVTPLGLCSRWSRCLLFHADLARLPRPWSGLKSSPKEAMVTMCTWQGMGKAKPNRQIWAAVFPQNKERTVQQPRTRRPVGRRELPRVIQQAGAEAVSPSHNMDGRTE